MRNIRKRAKQQNRGFSLFTVLIAVSFVGILGLLILYIALVEFSDEDYGPERKGQLYTVERALEEIRTRTAGGCGKCHVQSLYAGSENYNKDNSSKDASMDRLRKKEFQDCFITELMRTLRVSTGDKDIYNMERLRGYVDLHKRSMITRNL